MPRQLKADLQTTCSGGAVHLLPLSPMAEEFLSERFNVPRSDVWAGWRIPLPELDALVAAARAEQLVTIEA